MPVWKYAPSLCHESYQIHGHPATKTTNPATVHAAIAGRTLRIGSLVIAHTKTTGGSSQPWIFVSKASPQNTPAPAIASKGLRASTARTALNKAQVQKRATNVSRAPKCAWANRR